MIRSLLLVISVLGSGWIGDLPAQAVEFDAHFFPKTLRLDVHHGGTTDTEFFALEAVREEPVWAGPRTGLVTPFDRGQYQIRVTDPESGRLLYARGYSCVFGEWRTTAEAKEQMRVYRESRSLPYPRRPVQVQFLGRDRNNAFAEKFTCKVDPAAVTVRRDPPPGNVPLVRIVESGPPAIKVDLAVVAEGYPRSQMDLFEADGRRLFEIFFSYEPFRSRKSDFNVTLVCSASEGSGIDEPTRKRFSRSVVEASFNSFLMPRYVLVEDYCRLRDTLSGVPHDLCIILVNSDRYGGGGIYNWFMTATARHPWSRYVFVHEFGHAFAGLADEYYSSKVTYEDFYPAGTEPLAPNITRLGSTENPRKTLKWKDLVEADVPIPTPWPQKRYDALVRDLGRRMKRETATGKTPSEAFDVERELDRDRRKLLLDAPFSGKVGAFEGAGYLARGMFRPYQDCLMFSRSLVPFCPVCRRALGRMIDYLSRP